MKIHTHQYWYCDYYSSISTQLHDRTRNISTIKYIDCKKNNYCYNPSIWKDYFLSSRKSIFRKILIIDLYYSRCFFDLFYGKYGIYEIQKNSLDSQQQYKTNTHLRRLIQTIPIMLVSC